MTAIEPMEVSEALQLRRRRLRRLVIVVKMENEMGLHLALLPPKIE
jgi:hypothetical protein